MAVLDEGAVNGSMDLAGKEIESRPGLGFCEEQDAVMNHVAGAKGLLRCRRGPLVGGVRHISKGRRCAIRVEIDVCRIVGEFEIHERGVRVECSGEADIGAGHAARRRQQSVARDR
jgi:hypothetical protein